MSNNSHVSHACSNSDAGLNSPPQFIPRSPPPSLTLEATFLRKWQIKLAVQEMDELDARDRRNGVISNTHRDMARRELLNEAIVLQERETSTTSHPNNEASQSSVTQPTKRGRTAVRSHNDTQYNRRIVSVCGTEPEFEHGRLYEDIKRRIRGVCFSNAFVDNIPARRPDWGDSPNDLRSFYNLIEADVEVLEDGVVNKRLRWHLTMCVWKFVHDLVILERKRIQDPNIAHVVIHKALGHILATIRPFISQEIDRSELKAILFDIVVLAKRLGEALLEHENIEWSFTVPYDMRGKLVNQGPPCPWKDGMLVVDLQGATHQDASLDTISWVVFGPMAASIMDDDQCEQILIETRPWTVVYRPEEN
ncbi:hypothetical protein AK830_g636 [Neonectria ditissima]|uniref:Uncharacterized protein n=1 Tax=Neonectria ditissima TaxID=78410 RepID=A0A0P7BVW9_9HYPO|nr:hypothetical protein AK830_g636 [Neonectria ditissima]